ncbi:MAG: aromatic ring-hydroxylating dioxygenase subunit alpha [Actinomycetota bacterium]|nr:aromatic ring-hydroxylating dioxygenase subunit alpha [Actinomycetota bacterium]
MSARDTAHPLDELVRDDRVHRSLYTDPSVFETEVTRVFGATWTYLAHESELPETNDFVTRPLGRRPVIVTRDRDGEVVVLFNRCSHRGATVCRAEAGNTRIFTCPYHAWKFNEHGSLVAVPFKRAYRDDLRQDELGLGRVRCESYRGFVFATLDPHQPPLAEHLGPAARRLDEWIDRSPTGEVFVRHGAMRLECRSNWKLILDNSADGLHAGFSHRSLLTMRHQRYGAGVDMQYTLEDVDAGAQYVQDLGNGNTFLDQRGEIPRYWPQAAPSPGREAYEAVLRERLGDDAALEHLEAAVGSGMNLNIFPNLLIIGNQIQVVTPIDVDRTVMTWWSTSIGGVPDEINSIRMRLQEDFPNFGEPDDIANFEECQRGLAIPEAEWVMTHRHLHGLDEHLDEHGLVTGPASDELPVRAFWRRWHELMTSERKLVAQ